MKMSPIPKVFILLHWGPDIGSTDTEAASVSVQREDLVSVPGGPR